jgi:hypothetical protein
MVGVKTGARLLKAAGLAGSLLLGVSFAAQASTIVFSEDFSGATVGAYNTGSNGGTGDITGAKFKVTDADIDVLGPGNFNCVANPGGNCVDLIGGGGKGTIASTIGIDLHAGDTYAISYTDILQGFAPGASPSIAYKVSLGSTVFDVTSIPTVTPVLLSFTAASTELGALLTFSTVGNIDGVHGPVISGISISETAATVAATPIPATLPFLVSALGGLGLVGWRRKRAGQI